MGEWRYASYKRKGLSHLKDGTNCQDNTCVVETEDYIVAALADGLGSLKYSEIASDVATKSVCKAFENINCSKKELASYLLQYVVDNIQHEAEARGIALKDMDCTLVFVYISKNESKAIIGRLGDSAICVFGENDSVALNDGKADGFETTRSVTDQRRRTEEKRTVSSMQEIRVPIIHSSYEVKNEGNIGVEKKTHLTMSESDLAYEQNVENGNDVGEPYYKQVADNNESVSHQNDEPNETENKKEKPKKRGNYAFLILLVISTLFSLFLGILLTCLVMSKSVRNKTYEIDELKSEIVHLENEKERSEGNTEVDVPISEDNSCIHLDSDVYYWGELDEQNEPTGIGIMKDKNTYYIGTYERGKKNGQFTIVGSKGIETVEYKNDKVVESESLEKVTQEEHSED